MDRRSPARAAPFPAQPLPAAPLPAAPRRAAAGWGAALLVAGVAAGPGAARAEDHCMARILADVPALEAPEQVKSKSSGTFGPLSAVKVDKRSGKMFYCAVGTYCYDSNAFQLTTPCRFKLDKSFGSSFNAFFVYSAR